MHNSTKFLELCNEADAAHQVRSVLYPLKPIGLGTPYMECPSSYIIRLAEAHSVRLKEIVKIALQANGAAIQDPSVKKLNGMGFNVANILKGLEMVTSRNDLKLLGTLNWKGFIKNKNINKDHKTWCPNCFESWKRIGYILYEPLIWQISGIEFCYKHNTRLVSHCHSCKESLEVCSDLERIGYCPKCSAYLGKYKINKEYRMTPVEKEKADYVAESIVNARNIAELKPERHDQAITLKQVTDIVDRNNSVAFRLFQESSSEYKFY
ncbi:TniQ family protein [Paenibacillus sp. Soil750]|uniref:TniQ family protein n=1 Tax=Paenibacillus sp. Soil750 TaxID=1736398 RepID=UPI0006F8FB41|nr:TniQ family protein [Paenibacillus sp. Soil750]KRE73916.1 hypothetical protein ASL11_06250 [Paenibacillus sp. Soil750]